MVFDNENKSVTFTLTSAYNGNNGSWNYNGFYNGSANLVVPQGWNVNLKFHNPDGNYRHSVAVIKMFDPNNVPGLNHYFKQSINLNINNSQLQIYPTFNSSYNFIIPL